MSETTDNTSPQPENQESTEAPEGHEPERIGAEDTEQTTSIDELVAEWKAELEGQQSVSASNVQDRLLDLWGQLPEGNIRSEIEKWLTETVQRHLYAVADIDARLQRVLADA